MKAILACDPKGGIGLNGTLPWTAPEGDHERFRELIKGCTVIMGRKSWESPDMPKPLPDCKNIVVTQTPTATSAGSLLRPIRTLAEINNLTAQYEHNIIPYNLLYLGKHIWDNEKTWCIGGAQLFLEMYYLIKELHLTILPKTYDCDRFINIEQINNGFSVIEEQEFPDHTYRILHREWPQKTSTPSSPPGGYTKWKRTTPLGLSK